MRTFVRGLGQLFITAGLVVLLFTAYELWGTGLQTGHHQQNLRQQLHDGWAGAPDTRGAPDAGVVEVKPGQPLAVLWIPRFGDDWSRVIVEGVSRADLRTGPGHYPGTALPGQVGNFSVAGHRTTYGHPFNQLKEMRVGDDVVVETRLMWITYRVSDIEIVKPTKIDEVAPVPGEPGVSPTQRFITLTTCEPMYSAKQRLIVHALFDVASPKSAGRPAILAGGA